MSGVYKPLVIGLGLASAIVAIFVSRRMDAVDGDRLALRLGPFRLIGYIIWLLGEIAKSNWAVSRAILSRTPQTNQHLFPTKSTQKTDLGQVIFANSITLTPGTITVEAEGDRFWVHALSYSDDDPAALDDMDARVSATERGQG